MKDKNFLSFIATSSIGAWFDFIAILTFASYTLNASTFSVALTSVLMLLPQALSSKIYPKLISRFSFRSLLVVSTLIRGIVALASYGTIWVLFFLLPVRSFFIGLVQPLTAAYASADVTNKSDSLAVKINIISNVSKVVAPLLGGALGQFYGESTVFICSAAFAFIGIVQILFLDKGIAAWKADENDIEDGKSSRADVPIQLYITLSVYYFAVFSVNSLVPIIFKSENVPKVIFSISIAMAALGNVSAGLHNLKKDMPRNLLQVTRSASMISVIFLAIWLFLKGPTWGHYAIPLLFFASGIFSATLQINVAKLVFARPPAQAVKLSSNIQSLQNIAMIVAPFAGVIIAQSLDESYIFMAAGAISLLYFQVIYPWGERKRLLEKSGSVH